MLEETALPTELQPLPKSSFLYLLSLVQTLTNELSLSKQLTSIRQCYLQIFSFDIWQGLKINDPNYSVKVEIFASDVSGVSEVNSHR